MHGREKVLFHAVNYCVSIYYKEIWKMEDMSSQNFLELYSVERLNLIMERLTPVGGDEKIRKEKKNFGGLETFA